MSRLVYDSAHGRMCPRCRKPQAKCRCAEQIAAARPAGDGIVRVRREVRSGKTVTVVLGLGCATPSCRSSPAAQARLRSGGT